MKTQPSGVKRSLLSLVRGNSNASMSFDDDKPPTLPRVWATASDMMADQFSPDAA